MNKKDNIILVIPFISSFIDSDIAILSNKYNVKINEYNWKKKYLLPFYLFHQAIYLLVNIFTIKKIVVEFGGYWSLLPSLIGRLFRVPVFIILHGTDCSSLPEYKYGSLRKKLIRVVCSISYNNASMLLPVSKSLAYIENSYDLTVGVSKQGFKYFFPDNTTPYKVVYNGIDEDYWRLSENNIKESKSFLAVFSEEQFLLKGGDLILEVSNKFKDCKFYIAGVSENYIERSIPNNVFLLGRLTLEELREYYRKVQYHLQLSVIEGFGIALCESMLCECIAIGSSVNMIPEIIGDTGFILKDKNIDLLSEVIEKALSVEDKQQLGKQARNRIISKFSLDRRKKELLEVLNG